MLALSILLLAFAGCVIAEPSGGCDVHCHKHEHYVTNDVDCRKTCGNRLIPGQETAGACAPYTGCVCNKGYVRPHDNATGSCIPVSQCAPIPKNCCDNEEPSSCKIECPPQSCASIYTSYDCAYKECEPGCNCKNNYLRDFNGVCILSDNCPPQGETTPPPPQCGRNEVLSDCARSCPPQSCESLYVTYMCAAENCTVGCVCKHGYLKNSAGKCIPSNHCRRASYSRSGYSSSHSHSSSHSRSSSSSSSTSIICSGANTCHGDKNAVYKDCPSACPLTCEHPNPRPCTKQCIKAGCECKPGYILTKIGGKCIKREQCPGYKQCRGNETYVECRSACPAKCSDKGDEVCLAICLEAGCECKAGYVLNDAKDCVLPKDCPDKCKNHNATFSECPGACPATCAEPETIKPCIEKCLKPGCVCDQGYLLTQMGGVCIRPEDCPGGSPTCGKNETYAYCKGGCPTNYCPVDDSRAIVACSPPYPCPSGCVCKGDYLRLSQDDHRCILASDCPAVHCTRKHEVWNPQPLACRADKCYDLTNPTECNKPYLYDRPACVCEQGYHRDNNDICVPDSECFDCENHNATFSNCRTACPATCADPNANNKPCILICMPPGCECKPGYVLTEANGQCILQQDCPVQCADPNASFSDCPSACPATCGDIGDKACIAMCMEPGCVCNPGYKLSKPGGICVLPQNCPGQCTDPNASFSDCPSACPATCADPGPKPCIRRCMEPGCVCNHGFLLNEDGKCVLPEHCPDCYGDRNATFSDCPSACSVTCANPDSNKLCKPGCLEPGCACKFGYVRTEIGGKCVLPEDCSIHCADPNASFSTCPSACPAMCGDTGDTMCIQVCMDPGCVCNPGYMLTGPGGNCVLPENCPVDEHYCKARNATYKECRSSCPARCSTINSGKLYCPAVCREPGCECSAGYVLDDNDRCILPKDCPGPGPGQCTDPNASFSDCPSACPATCADPGPKPCIRRCMEPGCVCNHGFLLNEDGKCVLPEHCPAPGNCSVSEECRRTCGYPNPPNCPYTPAKTNIDGCECIEGYILSQKGGKCIKIEECPGDQSCNGDPQARVKQCPPPCPSTCSSPNQSPCKKMCEPIGCVCVDGYIYSKKHGKCVLPSECPGGDPCGPTAMFSSCNFDCPHNFCPKDDSREIILCKPPRDCPSGCVCKLNHKRLSHQNRTCVVSSSCPPVKCTRPCEVWNGCPSACLAENCEDVNNQPSTCNTFVLNCEPKCICEKNHFRNGSDICIPAADCPKPPLECGHNEIAVECRTICPPQNCEIAYTDYACGEPRCEPGCDCLPNHLRNGSGICILNDDCPYPTYPICGINEIARDCRRICPPQTCQSKLALYRCMENIPCEAGCDCVANYLRDASGVCIPSEECFATPTCSVPLECRRTCASPNPPNCPYQPAKTNTDGCNCQDGYILSQDGGPCIRIEDCPSDVGCNCDPHAKAKRRPLPCPSTCSAPNAVHCKRQAEPIGCECVGGYIFSTKENKCVLPEECPGGNPCGPGGRFVECRNGCPTDYCPVDDSRAIVACDPVPIEYCLSGCICELNHKKLSYENQTCVVSSTCPPVECKRQNEVWSKCPECLAEMCSDANNPPSVCNTLVLNCQPKCICKKNHFRNSKDLCVTREECISDSHTHC